MDFKMNPLLMEDILDGIFKKLPIEDLKNCRSVCLLWDKEVSARLKKVWKDMKIIDFATEYDTQRFTRTMLNSKDKKIFTSFKGLLNLISKLGSTFISEHEPKLLHIQVSVLKSEFEDLINILKLSSKNLVQFGIRGYSRSLIDLAKNVEEKKWLNSTFLKLETIQYDYDIFRDLTATQFIQVIQEIVENSPNLKAIENCGTNFSICSSKIWSSNMLEKLSKLTIHIELRVDEYIPVGQNLIQMQNQGLKLKYLDIRYEVVERVELSKIQSDIRVIEEFIQGQSGSLTTLKIGIEQNYKIGIHGVFPKIKKLVVDIFYGWTQPTLQLDLSSQFPQLEVLIVNNYVNSLVKWNNLFCGSGQKVHTLEFCKYMHWPDGDYRDLEKLFPHVVHLKIGFSGRSILECGEGFGNFWSKSIKSISIMTLHCQTYVVFDVKFFKIFKGLERIDFINRKAERMDQESGYWKAVFELLKSLENLKFIKLYKLQVTQSDLAELRNKYGIVDYTPGKWRAELNI